MGSFRFFFFEIGYVLIVNQRQADVVQPAQQTIAPEWIDLERITQPAIVSHNLLLQIHGHSIALLASLRA